MRVAGQKGISVLRKNKETQEEKEDTPGNVGDHRTVDERKKEVPAHRGRDSAPVPQEKKNPAKEITTRASHSADLLQGMTIKNRATSATERGNASTRGR